MKKFPEQPAWVDNYNSLTELRRKQIQIERLKKLVESIKKPRK